MSVYIFDEDAFERMVAVEGDDWKRAQLSPEKPFDGVSFADFLAAWRELYDAMKDKVAAQDERDFGRALAEVYGEAAARAGISSKFGDSAIYGRGGWTRYSVRNTGEIVFLEGLSPTPERTVQAREAGFTVF